MPARLKQLTTIALAALLCGAAPPADELDTFIAKEMAKRQITGLSLAIIRNGRIVETRAYGTTTRDGSERVTPATLFQAGSISKPVAALGALQLVERGRLSLDEDVNVKLKTWRVPDNEFTRTERVTVRRLLSHTAGLTVHGFPGYAVSEPVPSVPHLLDGKGNTAEVRVDVVPGSIWRYSGGGYTVLQQLMEDVTGRSFADYMQTSVLTPLGMSSSTYQQPLPPALAERTASGHLTTRTAVAGRWHIYPEMAAAGLWTTAGDLARFAIGVQQALAGKSKVLSADLARLMVTEEMNAYGLGFGVAGKGATLRFMHGGRDEGFDAYLVAYAESGDGLAVMINANDNSRMTRRIIDFVARKYGWPETPAAPAPVSTAPVALAAVDGHYEFRNNNIMTLFTANGRVYTDVSGLPDEEYVAVADARFASTERAVSFEIVKNAHGETEALVWTQGEETRRIPRIVPLFGAAAATDPDPAFTRKVMTVLQQFAEGGNAVAESTLLTAGARATFRSPNSATRDVQDLDFVNAQALAGRGIERHGHPVARTLQYRMKTAEDERMLLVHVDPNGLITDYDFVTR